MTNNKSNPAQDQNGQPTSYVRIPEKKLLEYTNQAAELLRLQQENNSLRSQLASLLALRSEQPTISEVLAPTPSPPNPLPAPADRTQSASPRPGPVPSGHVPAASPEALQSAVSALAPAISDALTLPKEQVIPKGASPALGVTITSQKRTAVPYWEIYKGTLDYIRSQNSPANHAPPIPYLLDERSISVIMEGIELGMTPNRAAALVGITKNAMERYRANATKEIEPYSTFFALIEMAEARTEADLVAKWQQHTRDSWQATEAFMKRRFAATWGDGSAAKTLSPQELASLSIEELARIANIDPNDLILEAEPIDNIEDEPLDAD